MEWLERVATGVWWSWTPARAGLFDWVYRVMNLAEGTAWLTMAVLVMVRHFRRGGGGLNSPYALAFALFGASDWVEAWQLSTPLIAFKFANLVALLFLRRAVIRRYYPDSRTY